MAISTRFGVLAGAVVAILGVSFSAQAAGRPDLVAQSLKAGRLHQPDELLVKYRDGATAADREAIEHGLGASKLDIVRPGNGKQGELALLKLRSGQDLAAAIRVLSSDPAVDYAEPNWVYTIGATSNDTYYSNGSLWGMYSATSTPAGVSHSPSLRACWTARISVGTINAPWCPPSSARASAKAATTVLPLPTSPKSRRCIG